MMDRASVLAYLRTGCCRVDGSNRVLVDARSVVVCSIPAILLASLVLLPFLHKAYTIDDVTFLLEAQHALKDPLHPAAFEMVFHGERIRLSHELVTGPVMAYLLIPAVLFGGAEWVAHSVQLALLIVGIVATVSLAFRLGLVRWQAALAGLLMVASPAVLAMAATAMADLPAMALGVAAMDRMVAWSQSRRRSTGVAAAILLALAVLTRPHMLLLGGCAFYWLVWMTPRTESRLRDRLRGILVTTAPVIAAVAILALFNELTRDPLSGASLVSATAHRSEGDVFWVNLANFPLQWIVAFPLGLLWPVLRNRDFVHRRNVVAFSAGVLVSAVGIFLPLAPLIGLGTAVLVDCIMGGWQQRDRVQVFLGMWLLLGLVTVSYAHLPAKYLVPSAPAMAILLARFNWEHFRRAALMTGTVLAGGVLLGVLIIRADAALAEVGRAGGVVAGRFVQQGFRVWMDGGWGFQWYAMAAGASPLADTPPLPRDGDIVVAGLRANLIEHYPAKTLLYRRVFNDPGGRVLGEGAGFYTSGPLPWVWGRAELGRVEVWRIESTREP